MHFYCQCGNRINDTTDMISYKARMIADQDWDVFLDAICAAIESKEMDREKVICEFYKQSLNATRRSVYQCVKCGRIFVEDQEHKLHTFFPEGAVDKRLLNSEKGSAWKGCLYAFWHDEKPEWMNYHGSIDPDVNIDYENLLFDDYKQFEARFWDIFKELKEKKLIRYAKLERNRAKIFSWDENEG